MKRPLYVRREIAAQERARQKHAGLEAMRQNKCAHKAQGGLRELIHLIRCQADMEEVKAAQAISPSWAKATYLEMSGMATEQFREFTRVFQLLARKSDHVDAALSMASGMQNIVRHLGRSVRPVAAWRPSGHDMDDWLLQLVRYLYGHYRVPPFIEHAFLAGEQPYADWYFAWTNGTSPRQFRESPVPISKSMAHYLNMISGTPNVVAALRMAQAMALGADYDQASAVAAGFHAVHPYFEAAQEAWLEDAQRPEVFWESVLRFLFTHKSLHNNDYGPILDYVFQQKYALTRGRLLQVKDRDFSMKGRSPVALIRLVNEWHHQLGLTKRFSDLPHQWPLSGIKAFEHQVGAKGHEHIYTIRELHTQTQLFREGNALSHCVASYIRRCVERQCSIWTMECLGSGEGIEKLLTIEVSSQQKIVQVRGKYNRTATDREMRVIDLWASRTGLTNGEC